MASNKSVSVKSLLERKFVTIPFEGQWLDLYGEPERNFRSIFYGPGGSGKSTYVLQFADYLGRTYGKVFYNSFEEGISQSLQTRCRNHNITAESNIFFGDRLTFEDFCEKMKRGRYRVGIIDSLQYMKFTYAQYQKLVELFPTKAFIFISQVNQSGKAKGGSDILHACDMKVYVNRGKATIHSRYGTGEKTLTLYRPASDKRTPNLFSS